MIKLLVNRLIWFLPLIVLVTFIVFLLIHLSPGDAAVVIAGSEGVSQEELARIRARLGLDQPLHVQYLRWMGGMLTGDLGTSLLSSRSVAGEVFSRLPVTLSLTLGSIVVALLISIPAGTIAAIRADTIVDRIVTFGATLGVATPNFFLGLLLILFVALGTGLFPTSGYAELGQGVGDWALHIIVPSIALGAAISAEMARHLRASLRDVLDQDYIRTARSKGLPAWKVVGKHGLKNAAIPVVTVLGLQITNLLSGSVVVEAVFGLPGLGNLLIRSVFSRDFPMIQGVMLITVLMVVVVNLLVDISYGYFNPKVRSS